MSATTPRCDATLKREGRTFACRRPADHDTPHESRWIEEGKRREVQWAWSLKKK